MWLSLSLMNLETLTLGLVLMTGCVVGFFQLLKFQDRWFEKMMRDRYDGTGGISV